MKIEKDVNYYRFSRASSIGREERRRGGFAGVAGILWAKGLLKKKKRKKGGEIRGKKRIGKKKRRDALLEGGTARERTESRFVKKSRSVDDTERRLSHVDAIDTLAKGSGKRKLFVLLSLVDERSTNFLSTSDSTGQPLSLK